MYRTVTTLTGVEGSPWISVLYFSELGGLASDALSAVNTFWGAVDALMENDVRWTTDSVVEEVDPTTGQVTGLDSGTSATATGSVTGTLLPPTTQGLIQWRTGEFVAGREIRGRTFVPGLASSQMTDGRPSSSCRTALQAAADALIADANSTLVVWSRKNGLAQPVTQAGIWTEFAVLRSRRD